MQQEELKVEVGKVEEKLLAEPESPREENDVRIAVVGNVDSGKSTLVGVLTRNTLDDGRGKARQKVFS